MKVVYKDEYGYKKSIFAKDLPKAVSIMNQLEISGVYNSWVE